MEQVNGDNQDGLADQVTAMSVTCPVTDCGFVVTEAGDATRAALINFHLTTMHVQAQRARPPPLPLPKLASQITPERYQEFTGEWQQFKDSSNIEASKLTAYLINCCEASLKTDIQSATLNLADKTEAELLALMKQHAVLARATSSLVTELLSARQSEDETVRKFQSRVSGIARNCDLTVQCPNDTCENHTRPYVPYTDNIVKHVVLNGIYDTDTRREVLGVTGLDDKSLAETVALIEDKETAARAVAGSATKVGGAMTKTAYGRLKKIPTTDRRLTQSGKCEQCAKTFQNRRLRQSKSKDDEIQVLKFCEQCWKDRRTKSGGGGPARDKRPETDSGALETEKENLSYFAVSEVAVGENQKSDAVLGCERPLGGSRRLGFCEKERSQSRYGDSVPAPAPAPGISSMAPRAGQRAGDAPRAKVAVPALAPGYP